MMMGPMFMLNIGYVIKALIDICVISAKQKAVKKAQLRATQLKAAQKKAEIMKDTDLVRENSMPASKDISAGKKPTYGVLAKSAEEPSAEYLELVNTAAAIKTVKRTTFQR